MASSSKLRLVSLCAALLFAALPVSAASCASEPGIGEACLVRGGFELDLGRHGRILTHGMDPAPADASASVLNAQPRAPICGSKEQFRFEALYVVPAGRVARTATMVPSIRSMIAAANAMFNEGAAPFGGTLDTRFLCEGTDVAVKAVSLSLRLEQITFQSLVAELLNRSFIDPRVKYVVWLDGRPPGAGGGTASIADDDVAAARNGNASGPSFAVNWGVEGASGAFVIAHEMVHTMGGVQSSAPHSTGSFHCTDGLDLMCYRDGGPAAYKYTTTACDSYKLDCNNDDYFHPAPRAGHYLRTHWNVGSPLNRFIEGCLSTGGEFKSGSMSLSYLVTTPVVHAIPPNCRGRLFAISDADASETSPLSGTLLACWRANGVVVGCGGLVLDEQGEVPLDADSVQLYGVGIRPIEYVFSIV